jgi:predicted amidophosphoribosyltransferase
VGVDAAWSAGAYEGTVRAAATALKFAARLQLAGRIAASIADRSPPGLLEGALVPVPPDPLRLIRRGFDPAEEIAVELSELTGRPVVPCLERRNGPRQVGRPRADRIADPPAVHTAFAPPERCVLVDDVHTTGATLASCAGALRAGGARHVVAVTFARA